MAAKAEFACSFAPLTPFHGTLTPDIGLNFGLPDITNLA